MHIGTISADYGISYENNSSAPFIVENKITKYRPHFDDDYYPEEHEKKQKKRI